MNNINYIGANELVYNSNKKDGIYSGGFSVNSTMLKLGLSPIITYNTQNGGNSNKVSDLFESLVIPNWALNYNNNIVGGEYKDSDEDDDSDDYEENNTENYETQENDEEIDDDLHNKLLDLVIVKENEIKNQKNKNKKTRKQENKSTKKGGTKRKKK